VAVPAYELFASTELLGRMAMERMLAKLSTRRYRIGLEPVGSQIPARSTSKSAVSRRFVAATETALAELMTANLTGTEVVALMIDGVRFGAHTCIVALAITTDGTKVPLGLVEDSTENPTTVTELLVGLRDRGLDVTRPVLVVIDGAKALAAAVKAVFDDAVIQRCQAAQDPQRRRPSPRPGRLDRRQADAGRLPRQQRPRRRGRPGGSRRRARQEPPRRGGQPPRRPRRDRDDLAPRRPADPRSDAAVNG
jgi:hypothetical protein